MQAPWPAERYYAACAADTSRPIGDPDQLHIDTRPPVDTRSLSPVATRSPRKHLSPRRAASSSPNGRAAKSNSNPQVAAVAEVRRPLLTHAAASKAVHLQHVLSYEEARQPDGDFVASGPIEADESAWLEREIARLADRVELAALNVLDYDDGVGFGDTRRPRSAGTCKQCQFHSCRTATEAI